jgi:hypothetical protein
MRLQMLDSKGALDRFSTPAHLANSDAMYAERLAPGKMAKALSLSEKQQLVAADLQALAENGRYFQVRHSGSDDPNDAALFAASSPATAATAPDASGEHSVTFRRDEVIAPFYFANYLLSELDTLPASARRLADRIISATDDLVLSASASALADSSAGAAGMSVLHDADVRVAASYGNDPSFNAQGQFTSPRLVSDRHDDAHDQPHPPPAALVPAPTVNSWISVHPLWSCAAEKMDDFRRSFGYIPPYLCLIALRDIRGGEQVCYEYGEQYWSNPQRSNHGAITAQASSSAAANAGGGEDAMLVEVIRAAARGNAPREAKSASRQQRLLAIKCDTFADF